MEIEVLGGAVRIDESYVDEPAGEIHRQLREYERGDRREFDLAVEVPDSFVGRVMEAMTRIPFGESRTYGDLAAALDTAPIAVGSACGENPVPVVVPCHRVVAADGSLGGYSEPGGVELKRRLLEHEQEVAEAGE